MERIREIARRLTPEAQLDQVIGAGAGMQYLRQVAAGEVTPEKDRIAAAQYLVNRQFGTAPVTLVLPEEQNFWQKVGVRNAIVLRDVIDVESDEFVKPFEPDEREQPALPAWD